MHEYGPMLLVFLGILGGIWLNRRDFADLKADMNRQFTEGNRRIDRIDDDLKGFHSITGKLDGRIDEIKARL